MPTKSFLDNPKHWRDRAAQTRHVAACMFDEQSKYRLLKIAWEYERLADCAEQRLFEDQKRSVADADAAG